jgi:DNA gyrase subunit A
MGLRPDRPYVKSSRVVGDVMGKLHPHGDTAIYDALVRLAQPFNQRLITVDGHGNFGSLDDGPAAPRYTEARLAPAAMAMTAGLDEDVVDFVPNYDNKLTQPEVLPAAIPNLLVNGAAGIAVGMATNMPPHNLVEVIAAARHLITHPKATLDDLMRFVPGPDLPTGGKIIGLDGIREAYETGRGTFRTRATARIEQVTAKKRGIVFTELPYQVGPERVIDRIKDAVSRNRIKGISAVVDLTDADHGLQLLVEVKSGVNPEAVLEQLYKYTPLEDSFGINNVALVDGQPRTLGLRDLLLVWVEHRLTVVRRRTDHRLRKATERLHLVDGLLIAIVDIDEVIEVIRSSDDAAIAKTRLMAVFDLDEVQAEYILQLRLRALTKFSRIELEREQDQLRASIEELSELLADDTKLRELVSAEMAEVAGKYGTPRRTILLESAGGPATSGAPLEVPDAPCWVLASATGMLARVSEPPVTTGPRIAHDVLAAAVSATTRSAVGAVTSQGRMLRIEAVDLPALPATGARPSLAGGVPAREVVTLEPDEQILTLVSLAEEDPPITLVTADGVIKRVTRESFPAKESLSLISLKPGDEVVAAFQSADLDWIVIITEEAQLLRFQASAVRPQGRPAGGMAGIRTDTRVLWAGAVADEQLAQSVVVTIAGQAAALAGTQAGSAKVTPLAAYPSKGRATGGVRCQRFLSGEDALILAWAGPGPARAVGGGGQPMELPDVDPRRDGSGTQLAAPVFAVSN